MKADKRILKKELNIICAQFFRGYYLFFQTVLLFNKFSSVVNGVPFNIQDVSTGCKTVKTYFLICSCSGICFLRSYDSACCVQNAEFNVFRDIFH